MTNASYVDSVVSQQFVLIRAELNQEEVIELIVNVIQQLKLSEVKTVSVIGGAASGKTTIAGELVKSLRADGVRADRLSTDSYVIGDRAYRQEQLKNVDAQKKYDFELMDEHIRAIRKLKDDTQFVAVPTVDSKTGVAVDVGKANYDHSIKKLDVLVIEGDFPRDDYDIRFYIQVPDAQRLENNIERETDKKTNLDVGQLTEAFNDRQRTLHKPYTLPAMQSADYILKADVEQQDWLYTVYQREQ